ncbi:MAG: hypothetical protein ABI821_00565 [Pseudomonadota bacterium]
MKTTTLSLLAATAVFAGASIYLAVELGRTRDELAAATQPRAAPDTRVGQPEANDFHEMNAAQPVPAASPPGALAPPPEGPPPVNQAINGRGERRAESNDVNTAAAQRQRRLQQETRLRQLYSDMPRDLGLDKAQADKLFDLLADSRETAANNRRAYADDPLGRQALADAARRERDAAIDALLGPGKAAEFLTYEKSIGARMQVGRIDAQMTAADIPLGEDQRNAMIVELAAEQAARPMPERDPSDSDADYQARYREWQAEYSRRAQERIEPLLTSEQRSRYREAIEVQNARRAAQRARAESRRNAQPQP